MTDDTKPEANNPPHSVMERIEALEKKVAAMDAALRRAHGDQWLDQVTKERDAVK